MRFFWLTLVALGLGTKRHWHILFAIVLGIVFGLLFSGPQYSLLHRTFEAVGEVFIRLIQMIVIPLVVSSLVVGVSALSDNRQIGRLSGKVLSLFLGLMILATLLGGALGLFFEPGRHLRHIVTHPAPAQQDDDTTGQAVTTSRSAVPSAPSVAAPAAPLHSLSQPAPSLKQLFFDMIPQNPLGSLARAELVPVIVFTLVFGLAIAFIGEAGKPLVAVFEAIFTATMKITDWVMVLSVPGIFSLTFMTVATAGADVFLRLAPYSLVLFMALLIQLFVILPLMLKFLARVDFMNLYRAISEAIMVAFGTASSSATLPITLACCERRVGISNRIASFVLPTGVTINKTGTTIMEVVAVLFLTQAYGITLAPYQLVLMLVFAVVASIGTAGVPSGGLLTIAIVLNSLGLNPLEFTGGLAMLWSIDRVLDMCRTVVNVASSCSVAAVVAAQEGELNRELLNNHERWVEVI
jgi:Na+/H+-dicarboxylate symporter